MNVGNVSGYSSDIQSLLYSGLNKINRNGSANDSTNKTANYAKKGEPMYMEEMDSDGDGVVTLDEFKAYCKDNGINTKQMIKMSQMASLYRTMQAETEAIDSISKFTPNISPYIKQTNNESAHVKDSENKFNISADPNNDKMVSYKEYIEYCEQNAEQQKINPDTEKTEDKDSKNLNYNKAVSKYKSSKNHGVVSTFEEVA